MRHLILILFCVAGLMASAQTNSGQTKAKRNAWYMRWDVDRLTDRVVKGCDTDEQKVEAIYTWITHNIRYDIDKFLERDYERDDIRRILFRRKAICLGYADLFDAMCKRAGVGSVMVPGYVKTLELDIVDSFYLDEHAWNAVKVNDEWYHVDNTWDAGYVRWYRRTLLSFMANMVFIPYKQFKYDPKFIQDPTTSYYLKSGEYFSFDHLASNPTWQLINNPLNIEEFRRDSSFYFLTHKSDDRDGSSNTNERDRYVKLDRIERLHIDGEAIVNHNHRNHYTKAVSDFLNAQQLYIDAEEVNSSHVEDYEEVHSYATLSIINADSTYFFIREQRDRLLRNNRKKYKIQLAYNKEYSKYLNRLRKMDLKMEYKLRNQRSKCKRDRKGKALRMKRLEQTTPYSETEYKHQFEQVADSLRQVEVMDSIEMEYKAQVDSLTEALGQLDTLLALFDHRFQLEREYVSDIRSHFYGLFIIRVVGFDDYDHPIKKNKAEFALAHPSDSFLYLKPDLHMMDSLRRYYKRTHHHIKQTQTEYARLNRSMKVMKRMMHRGIALDERHAIHTEIYYAKMEESEQWYKTIGRTTQRHSKMYKRLAKKARKCEKRAVKPEGEIHRPDNTIKYHAKGLSAAAKDVRKHASRLQRKSANKILKLQPENE